MLTFLLSLLILLLYAGFVLLVVFLLIFFFEKIFGQPVPARAAQLIYAIVALIFVIWLLDAFIHHTPIPAPWQWNSIR